MTSILLKAFLFLSLFLSLVSKWDSSLSTFRSRVDILFSNWRNLRNYFRQGHLQLWPECWKVNWKLYWILLNAFKIDFAICRKYITCPIMKKREHFLKTFFFIRHIIHKYLQTLLTLIISRKWKYLKNFTLKQCRQQQNPPIESHTCSYKILVSNWCGTA